jgi:TolB-like protein
MFTDIQGYTAMMQHDEALALKIRERHRMIFTASTEKFNGKILQYFGDGTLSIFSSSIDAVKCAMEMQLAFQKEPVIPVRIGIHSGDIIYSDEEIIGDGVNVAARIESLAVPGSVFISDKIYDEIKNQASIHTRSLQTFELKNVERPIEVFAISNKGLVVPSVQDIKGKAKERSPASGKASEKKQAHVRRKRLGWMLSFIIGIVALVAGYFIYERAFLSEPGSHDLARSIAVLAFENMSDDPDQEYFSDGISEEILNSLVKIEGLKVAGRTSSFSFKGKDADIRTIGSKLGVGLVLEGSVRKAEDRVRITAQLINVADGYHIWSERYDRELKDIFAIQEEIATNIVKMLKLTVLRPAGSRQPTKNIEAYDLYLKGLYALSLDVEGVTDALEYFQKAIELDLGFALAYAGKADAFVGASGYGVMPVDSALAEARKAAEKSITLDREQTYGHKSLAYVHLFYDWDWEAAKSEYDKALELGLADPDHFAVWYEALLYGNFDRAIRDAGTIVERDPLSLEAHWYLGLSYHLAGRYEEAIAAYQNAVKLNPDYSEAHRGIGASYCQLEMYDKASAALEKALELSQGQGPAVMDMLTVLGASGQKEELKGRIDDLLEIAKQHTVPPIVFAIGYAHLGDMDEAFKWLERTYEERFLWFISIKVAADWDVFRDDARFMEFIERMNFPESADRQREGD